MRRFFIFILLLMCFVFAGMIKENSANFASAVNIGADSDVKMQLSNFSLDKFLQDVKGRVMFCEEVGGSQVYYIYANNIKPCAYVRGVRINAQVSINGENVYIGYPLIKGSF